jgi:PAS domain S-box-containing protein
MTSPSETDSSPSDSFPTDSDERLRLFVETVADYAIFTVDTDNRITTWNTGAERLLGWTECEAIGCHADMVFTPEDRASGEAVKEFVAAAETGSAADERVHIRKDGSRFWASGTLMAMRDANGANRGFAKIMRDNTERRLAQANLERALREAETQRAVAEAANRMKDEFISTVSHELRTPLNSIRLWTRIMSRGKLPAEDLCKAVRVIERAAVAQQQLIDDLLDVSRMESGKLRLAVRPVALTESISGAIEAVQPMLENRDLFIEQSLSDEIGSVSVDPERIQQVVWNLVANSIKFTPDGGSIRISARRAGDDVEIRVEDTGAGIARDFLPHVFDRFRQAESITTRTHGGLGLGLAIAKQVINLHGGTIRAASEGPGFGSVFTVTLPLPELQSADDEHAEADRKQVSTLQGVTILLVEDEPAAREALQRLLELDGAEVRAASDAAEAREAYLTEEPPDFIVCDIGLPSEDGLSLIRWLRQTEHQRNRKRVPALALTAFARADDERAALAAGFDKHVPKPVNEETLVASINENLNRHVA